jgi:hypothetical protein
MTQQEIEELAGHRSVSPWIIKLVGDAVAKEREACAKTAEDKGLTWKSREDIAPDNAKSAYMASQFIAQAIRARGDA